MLISGGWRVAEGGTGKKKSGRSGGGCQTTTTMTILYDPSVWLVSAVEALA